MTLTLKSDLDMAKLNHHAKYLNQIKAQGQLLQKLS